MVGWIRHFLWTISNYMARFFAKIADKFRLNSILIIFRQIITIKIKMIILRNIIILSKLLHFNISQLLMFFHTNLHLIDPFIFNLFQPLINRLYLFQCLKDSRISFNWAFSYFVDPLLHKPSYMTIL